MGTRKFVEGEDGVRQLWVKPHPPPDEEDNAPPSCICGLLIALSFLYFYVKLWAWKHSLLYLIPVMFSTWPEAERWRKGQGMAISIYKANPGTYFSFTFIQWSSTSTIVLPMSRLLTLCLTVLILRTLRLWSEQRMFTAKVRGLITHQIRWLMKDSIYSKRKCQMYKKPSVSACEIRYRKHSIR